MTLKTSSQSVLVACMLTWPLVAADELLVRAPRPYVQQIADRFGMAILQQVPGQDLFRVRGPQGVPADQVMAWVRNYDFGDNDTDDDDDDDVLIERNATVTLPELGVGNLIGSTRPASDAVADRTSTSFFGDIVRSSYVRQPMMRHIGDACQRL